MTGQPVLLLPVQTTERDHHICNRRDFFLLNVGCHDGTLTQQNFHIYSALVKNFTSF